MKEITKVPGHGLPHIFSSNNNNENSKQVKKKTKSWNNVNLQKKKSALKTSRGREVNE